MKQTFLTLLAIFIFTACSSDDSEEQQQPIIQSHIVEFTTGTLESWVSVILTTTLHFEDGTQSVIDSDFDNTQNIVSVVIPQNTLSFELEFYIEDSSQAQMKFYGADNNEVIHQETTTGQVYEYDYTFQ